MLKKFIHFIDNSEAENNKRDKAFKVRPLYTKLQQSYMKFGIFEENLSIDEMIVRYYGHHSLKQFIHSKPICFGYKLWALCGVSGYCYNFDLYCGKTVNTEKNSELLLGSKVVLKMLSVVENLKSCTVFFDNLFTDYPLLVYLRNLGFQATGTIREHRLSKCILKDSKLSKKEKRGSYDYRFDCNEEILIVKWLDNKCVTVGTNYDTVEQIKTVQQWQKERKARGPFPQPHVLYSYNQNMGGVDKHDWLVGKYSVGIPGKKWCWPLFTRILDMTMVNAWIIYKFVNANDKEVMSLLDFKRQVCVAYLKGADLKEATGRKKSHGPSKIAIDVRFDCKEHFLQKCNKQRRCQNQECKAKPRTYCNNCNVTLCIDCFVPYHSK